MAWTSWTGMTCLVLFILGFGHADSNPFSPRVRMFFHFFVGNESKISNVLANTREQLAEIGLERNFVEVEMNSIGILKFGRKEMEEKVGIGLAKFQHLDKGWEDLTLHQLWSFCRQRDTDPNQIVVYLHSKGSFHTSPRNEKLRRYVTKGALSKECLEIPEEFNVCSTRMTPLPYAQTSGNMWSARCSYVAKLKDPSNFSQDMRSLPFAWETLNYCVGRGRFSDEHWIYSHPDCSPCDLDSNQTEIFTGLDWNLEKQNIVLAKAPRFPLPYYRHAGCAPWGENVSQRLSEYRLLYGTQPKDDWWGKDFFNKQ